VAPKVDIEKAFLSGKETGGPWDEMGTAGGEWDEQIVVAERDSKEDLHLQAYVSALRRRGLEGSVIDRAREFMYTKDTWEILADDITAQEKSQTMAFASLRDNLLRNPAFFEQFVSMPVAGLFLPTVRSAFETLFATRTDEALRLLRLYGVSESGIAPWVPEWRANTMNRIGTMDPQTFHEFYLFERHCHRFCRREFDVRLQNNAKTEGIQMFDLFEKDPDETKSFVWNWVIEQEGWWRYSILAKVNDVDRRVARYLDTLVWEEEENLVLLRIAETERRSYFGGIRVAVESNAQNTDGRPLYVIDALNLLMLFSPEEWPRWI
jgi:hypothetical protein